MMVDYDKKKDSTLVDMTLLGDEKAYEALVRRHESKVLGTAYKVTGNTFSAEDDSQDAFVSAWMNLDDLREKEKFFLLLLYRFCQHFATKVRILLFRHQ